MSASNHQVTTLLQSVSIIRNEFCCPFRLQTFLALSLRSPFRLLTSVLSAAGSPDLFNITLSVFIRHIPLLAASSNLNGELLHVAVLVHRHIRDCGICRPHNQSSGPPGLKGENRAVRPVVSGKVGNSKSVLQVSAGRGKPESLPVPCQRGVQ
jgi:hypothetical protein